MAISEETIFLDPGFSGSLQSQIQQIVASAILSGRFLPGEKMPSSRKLAKHLGVSRITVTLAYSELVAADYLSTASRSGFYISQTAPAPDYSNFSPIDVTENVDWSKAIISHFTGNPSITKPADWRQYPYPFIYGQADPKLFDQSNWRQCALQALGMKEFDSLTTDYGERDDPELIEFIARHTLPRRGILAKPEQILVTVGAQNALWITAQLLLNGSRTAVIENPSYPGLRDVLRHTGCRRVGVDVDKDGLAPENIPDVCDVVFTHPSHQSPTAVTMPIERRHKLLKRAAQEDFIIVEDDYEFEMSFLRAPTPALKSLDTDGRVIYVGSFSKSLFPGLRLGYLVGSEGFIKEARALRMAMLRHPPGHTMRTTANFLRLGHYDTLISRLKRTFQQRRRIMQDAIISNGLEIAGSASFGGSSFWMRAPKGVDTVLLAKSLLDDGVVIEPGYSFFSGDARPQNYYRLSYSSIDGLLIPEGIARVAKGIGSAG
jgi:GntR family transcriptional regulator/MocR family aminotransferase